MRKLSFPVLSSSQFSCIDLANFKVLQAEIFCAYFWEELMKKLFIDTICSDYADFRY